VESYVRNALVPLYPRLRRFAASLTGSEHDGDDLVQHACERALTRVSQWQPGTRLDSWLFRIIHNSWIDDRRSARARTRAPIEEAEGVIADDGEARMQARLTLEAVRREFGTLTAEHRAVLTLVCIDGLSYREAADVLGIPVGTVMSRLARARLDLAGRLDRHGSAVSDNVLRLR
jgi:RNA polymerase sigma-70 factor (ECF subfamily)